MWQGYAFVPKYDDEALMEAVYSRGPIAVSLDASPPSFRFYSGGRRLCDLNLVPFAHAAAMPFIESAVEALLTAYMAVYCQQSLRSHGGMD